MGRESFRSRPSLKRKRKILEQHGDLFIIRWGSSVRGLLHSNSTHKIIMVHESEDEDTIIKTMYRDLRILVWQTCINLECSNDRR